jgi:hypothetical protein
MYHTNDKIVETEMVRRGFIHVPGCPDHFLELLWKFNMILSGASRIWRELYHP